jgi:putative phosphoribosyl transferase
MGTSLDNEQTQRVEESHVRIPMLGLALEGDLRVPPGARGLVVFAHGSGSSRHSPRNRKVASELNKGRLATLLMDLLTREEEAVDQYTGHLRFDIGLLAERLAGATEWLRHGSQTRDLDVGVFGASTGGAAALIAAAEDPDQIRAVVIRGGRPDLAGPALSRVRAPTLFIVGGDDDIVLKLNRSAMSRMNAETRLEVIPGATHLFEEPGAMDAVSRLARAWFERHLAAVRT